MKRLVPLLALLFILAACDHIDETDRLVYVKPAPAQRVVLIEDFTGQRCVNCPKAAEVIEQLEEQYPGSVIAVGIHSGPFSRSPNGATRYPLATDEGDAYYSHWQCDRQPVGMVNRQGLSDYPDWTAQVHQLVQLTAPLTIEVRATITSNTLDTEVQVLATDGDVTGNLQLWLVEDGIVSAQYMPDGTVNRDYVHNHVLRCAINGTWGEPLALTEGQTATAAHQLPLAEGWNQQQLRVVAFVYNDTGVLQAAQAIAISTETE